MRISDWSSDVCSSDLGHHGMRGGHGMMMKADTNGDKAISQTEFQTAALARFDAQDANKDGQVTAAERKAAREAKRAEWRAKRAAATRSEEHTSELQSLMRISYAVFCLNKKNTTTR